MTFLRYIWLSCSGFRTYVEFLDLPMWRALGYWAMLSAILGAVALFNAIEFFETGFPPVVESAEKYLPEFSLSNGVAYSSLPQPYFSNTNQFPMILDLKDTLKTVEKDFPAGIVIRRNEMIFWKEGYPTLKQRWMGLPDGTVNRAYLEEIQRETLMATPIVFVLFWLGILLVGLLQAFFFSSLSGFMERTLAPNFTFPQLFNIAIFSLTPGCIIIATYGTIRFNHVNYGLVYFMCYTIFFILASNACRMKLRPEGSEGAEED